MKAAMLIIDMQNDFASNEGALYVDGAEDDIQRTIRFIQKNGEGVNTIYLTSDDHHVMDISHPGFWKDQNNENPEPMTPISYEDIKNGKWEPVFNREEAITYVRALEENGEFGHVIWPEHCIMGTRGAAIAEDLMEVVRAWARQGKYFHMIRKGSNPMTEHFGVFRANIPIPGKPETQKNKALLNELSNFSEIYVAGEAKSHCVANTIKQLFDYPYILKKITILEDCMSDIKGFEKESTPIYEEAKSRGVRIARSEERLTN